jgi:chromate transporter
VPFGEALKFWLRLGFISFGGPAGQIAIMHRELVEQKRWISERRFLHALNYCMLLPGPEAQQLATYIGWLMHRTWGGIVAGALFVLPSLFILIALSWIYLAFGEVDWVAGLFYGIKPAVAAIVLHAVWRIGSRTLRSPRTVPLPWGDRAGELRVHRLVKVPFPLIVGAAALVGVAGARFAPEQFAAGGGHGKAGQSWGPALIDDHTPTPPHAHFRKARLAQVALVGAALWLLPMALLVATHGLDGTPGAHGLVLHQGRPAHLRRRLCGAALRLPGRGGALPVAHRRADDRRPRARRDHARPADHGGGPSSASWAAGRGRCSGPDALFAGAALAATVVTWFTFLPSFLFILAGGPLVESTHGDLRFTAPLTAITAAVVGVIGSLALFFLLHIAQARPALGLPVDGVALAIAAAAARRTVPLQGRRDPVIAACALLGMALRLAGAA